MQGLSTLQNNDKALVVAVSSAVNTIASQIKTIADLNAQVASLQAQIASGVGDDDTAVGVEAQVVADQTTALNTAVATVSGA